ncbi:MAG: DUF4006 family protein [Campylobacter sp.]|uniref:DUF4006 family protein n=1 Tax=Campylobacter sp. TaxID=205 RepID=UPI002A4C2392|nr:DUF4006 family protein [Campylobacter sp.]MDD6925543.1 DUF4006 family protein [Campylobacteraceae bacterium]MCI6339670.1 DUF4006 family protein [Campylobacter sp.]MCI6579934.1 DUF4006 family protein [Campylobacter sp.]MDD7090418.1 DUF4006 family protein [Campylobacteraceae bacterium]MDY5284695.1 DUF4006 family protein [Campylobacter sp.]
MENQNRSVFGLGGVGGMLLTTVVLLSILVVLTVLGIQAQQDVMQKPYEYDRSELADVKMLDSYETESKIMRSKE